MVLAMGPKSPIPQRDSRECERDSNSINVQRINWNNEVKIIFDSANYRKKGCLCERHAWYSWCTNELFMEVRVWPIYAASRLETAARLWADRRTYARYAELFHLPRVCMRESSTPLYSCSCCGSTNSKSVTSITRAVNLCLSEELSKSLSESRLC